ncbi:YitT family protein [Mycoplasmopsis primatum]|uniref:YitT family protein n=1 Tax=Mycoplasmopsis primatum TaxID=55604 RepID=UPI0004982906|nr:YitT family protein [Mycoplasmopsis primatum]
MSKLICNIKIARRKSLLKKLHRENIQNLKEIENDQDNIDLKKYFGDDKIWRLRMARYSYDNDDANKKRKNVKKRTILLYAKRLFFIFISAIIFNLAVIAFLNRGDTIPSGLSGFPMLAILISKDRGYFELEKYFALLYIGVNLPLLLGFGFKIKKSFTLLTVAFMVFQLFTNMIFTTIPQVKDFIHDYINIVPGWYKLVEIKDANNNLVKIYENANSWPVIINGFIGSIFAGTAIAIAWKNGGSTGGTDIIAYYFSTKKQKSVASVLFAVNLSCSTFFLIVFGLAAPHKEAINLSTILNSGSIKFPDSNISNINSVTLELMKNKTFDDINRYVSHATVFGVREFATILYIMINNVVLNILYPKYKKVSIEISTRNLDIFTNYFKQIKYWHAYTIYTAKGGYSNSDTYVITTAMLYLEAKYFVDDLKIVDPSAWIVVRPIEKVYGSFNTSYVDK